MKQVSVRAKADADIDRALDYYALEAPRPARRLLAAFATTFERIARAPGAGSARFAQELDLPGLRHRATRGFPYLVFYFELLDEIAVVRVLHQRSDIPAELSESPLVG